MFGSKREEDKMVGYLSFLKVRGRGPQLRVCSAVLPLLYECGAGGGGVIIFRPL